MSNDTGVLYLGHADSSDQETGATTESINARPQTAEEYLAIHYGFRVMNPEETYTELMNRLAEKEGFSNRYLTQSLIPWLNEEYEKDIPRELRRETAVRLIASRVVDVLEG